MHNRYNELVSDEISDKIKKCDMVDEWVEEATDEIKYEEKMRTCTANILNVYGEQYIMEISYVTLVLYKMKLNGLIQICQDMGIPIHNKILKRKSPEEAIANRILSQYSKPRVGHRLKSFASHSLLDVFPMIGDKELPHQEKLDMFIERLGSMYKPTDDEEKLQHRQKMLMFSACITAWAVNDEDFSRFIQNLFTEEHWEIYQVSIWSAYCAVFYTKTNSQKLNMNNLLNEKKQLESKYNSQVKEQKQLNERLVQTTQEKDKLKGAITELNKTAESQLEDAVIEIGRLGKQLEYVQQEADEEVGSLKNVIIHLQNQLAGKSNKPLEGLTVCVVGIPNDEQFFKQTITKYGGNFEFFPSVLDSINPRLMAGPINRSDVVLYCHSYTSHTVRDLLKSIAADKTEYLESNGKSSFEHLLLTRIIPKLRSTTLTK
jgi:hypothetical protein